MKKLLFVIVFLLSRISLQAITIVDGITYQRLSLSDTIVGNDGKRTLLDIKVDYPIGSSMEDRNIREIIGSYIFFDMAHGDVAVEIPAAEFVDSLHCWIEKRYGETIDSLSIRVEAVVSGVEGITTIKFSNSRERHPSYSSFYNKIKKNVTQGILDVERFESCILKQIRAQKSAIIDNGIEYFEPEDGIDWILFVCNFGIVDGNLLFFYHYDCDEKPYYISFPVEEVADLFNSQIVNNE